MDHLWIEVAKAVPALLVLAWVVNRFLTASKERDDAFKQTAEGLMGAIRENNQALGRAGALMDTVGEDMARTRKVLHETQEVLARNRPQVAA